MSKSRVPDPVVGINRLADNAATTQLTLTLPLPLHIHLLLVCAEFCDLGTFTSYASKVLTDPCDEQQMLQLLVLLQDAARGIAALHSSSVVHGDGEWAGRLAGRV